MTRRHVLLVDDSAAVRSRLADLMRRASGVTDVTQAASLAEARAALREGRPDAVVLDLDLPDGNGLELIDELRARLPQVLLIILTNSPTAEYRNRCLALGANYFLDKTLECMRVPALLADASGAPQTSVPTPQSEMQRLLSLLDHRILDTPSEQAYDDITALAAQICATPMAVISLLDADRQWFKSRHGMTATSTPRSISFCTYAIESDDLFIVPDTHEDARFANNPMVVDAPFVRFYAGMPLQVSGGHKLGTLCVIDTSPRQLSDEQRAALQSLARQAVGLLEYRRLTVALQTANDARTAAERRLEEMATRDDLTGLDNRPAFRHALQHELLLGQRQKTKLACLYLDLDNFKLVNDSLGHPTGDALLVAAAKRIRACVRESDTVARLGGDEFGLVLANVGGVDDVIPIATKLREALTQPYPFDGHVVHVGCSIGISIAPDDGLDVDTLVQQADTALYHAKGSGKGAFQFFAREMNDRVTARLMLEEELRKAVAEQAFTLHFQPQIDCESGEIIGAEALLRWPRLEPPLLSPSKFLAVAEELRLGDSVASWVLASACRQFAAWRRDGVVLARLAVNIYASQLKAAFVDEVAAALALHGMAAHELEIEIIESQLMDDQGEAAAVIGALRERGVRVALDDFGIGYSSLALLKDLPVDTLKVDRSFVSDIAAGGSDAAVVAAMIALAHRMNLRVTAEGVEDLEQLIALRAMGCDDYQGYLGSPALAAEAFADLWRGASTSIDNSPGAGI